jgi:hypothetical protein
MSSDQADRKALIKKLIYSIEDDDLDGILNLIFDDDKSLSLQDFVTRIEHKASWIFGSSYIRVKANAYLNYYNYENMVLYGSPDVN